MANSISSVDQRTSLVGHNRLELLLFQIDGPQRFGINVFKVREAIPCPALTKLPHSHPVVRGIASIRGQMISVFDIAQAMGKPAVEDLEKSFVIITEYNRSIQGFLVQNIDRIVNTSWENIHPAPTTLGNDNYMTALTHINEQLVEIIDIEKILEDVIGSGEVLELDLAEQYSQQNSEQIPHVLIADDSHVALKQIKRTMSKINVNVTTVGNGKEALSLLTQWADEGTDINQHIDLLISDIEMPEMDGYTLTSKLRQDPRFSNLKILLHSSMSGTFNESMVQKVGADKFIAKFSPNELADAVQSLIKQARAATS